MDGNKCAIVLSSLQLLFDQTCTRITSITRIKEFQNTLPLLFFEAKKPKRLNNKIMSTSKYQWSINRPFSANANRNNVTLETIDKRDGTLWKQTAYRNSVVSMMYSLNLIDIFRKLKPNTKSYSYESKFLKVKSRIDYFLIAKNLTNLVQNVGTKTAITPDHKAIKLCLKPFKSTRGPGLWKFNNSLLKDAEYLSLISDKYPIIREKYTDIADKRLTWEMIKMELRGVTISFAKYKAKIC